MVMENDGQHTATIHRSSGLVPRQQPKFAQIDHLLILVTSALSENTGGWTVVVRRHVDGEDVGRPRRVQGGLKLEWSMGAKLNDNHPPEGMEQ